MTIAHTPSPDTHKWWSIPSPLSGCIPFSVTHRGSEARVRWIKAKATPFRDPFFTFTAMRLLDRALRTTVRETSMEELLIRSRRLRRLTPTGFVFHISRCGSTAISNALAALDEHLVMSEPGAPLELLGPLLEKPGPEDDRETAAALRACIDALSAAGTGRERRYFVKFFSGNVLQLPLIRAAFPDVPELFLYRDPLEVVVSNLSQPVQGWCWSEGLTGLPLAEAVERPVAELVARAIGRKLSAMHDGIGPHTRLMNYSQFDAQTPETMAQLFGFEADPRQIQNMRAALALDAKDPSRTRAFVSDGQKKRERASDFVHSMVARFAAEPYERLEELRRAREKTRR